MLKDFTDESTQLVLETPSGLPENIRHALNVLSSLGVKDDAMLMAVVGDTISVDPNHICRMVQKGLLSEVPGILHDKIAFAGTELHIPMGGDEAHSFPPCEVIVSLHDNAMTANYFDKEAKQYQYVNAHAVYPSQVLSYISVVAERGGADKRTGALTHLFIVLFGIGMNCYARQTPLKSKSLFAPIAEALAAARVEEGE